MNRNRTSCKVRIAVIGGGAVGVALLYQLVEQTRIYNLGGEMEIFWFDENSFGPGKPYQRDGSNILLNQHSTTMSGVHDDPEKFHRWAVDQGYLSTNPKDKLAFLPRWVFGEYLLNLTRQVRETAKRNQLRIQQVLKEVVSITENSEKNFIIRTQDGKSMSVNQVILAVGNLKSRRFATWENHPAFISTPYPTEKMIEKTRDARHITLIGSRLSAIDGAVALLDSGFRGKILMTSRSGDLPTVRSKNTANTPVLLNPTAIRFIPGYDSSTINLRELYQMIVSELHLAPGALEDLVETSRHRTSPLRFLSSEIEKAEEAGRPWQTLALEFNQVMETLWCRLAPSDKDIFIKKFYSKWLAYRIPIPAGNAKKILRGLKDGRLEIASEYEEIRERENGFLIRTGKKGSFMSQYVVDATGTPRDIKECESALISQMIRDSLLAPNSHGGVTVEFSTSRAITPNGRTIEKLYVIGNLTCGTHFFTSALQLNAIKAKELASAIAHSILIKTQKEQNNASLDLMSVKIIGSNPCPPMEVVP